MFCMWTRLYIIIIVIIIIIILSVIYCFDDTIYWLCYWIIYVIWMDMIALFELVDFLLQCNRPLPFTLDIIMFLLCKLSGPLCGKVLCWHLLGSYLRITTILLLNINTFKRIRYWVIDGESFRPFKF